VRDGHVEAGAAPGNRRAAPPPSGAASARHNRTRSGVDRGRAVPGGPARRARPKGLRWAGAPRATPSRRPGSSAGSSPLGACQR